MKSTGFERCSSTGRLGPIRQTARGLRFERAIRVGNKIKLPGTTVYGGDIKIRLLRMIEHPQCGKRALVVDDGLEQAAALGDLPRRFVRGAKLPNEDRFIQLACNRHGFFETLFVRRAEW